MWAWAPTLTTPTPAPPRSWRSSAALPAKRHVTVGVGATITGRTVALQAVVNRLDVSAISRAKAINPVFFGVASAFARSKVDVWSDAKVHVDGGSDRTIITGTEGVDLISRHMNPAVKRNSTRLAVALIFPQQSVAEGADHITTSVDTDPGSTIVAGARPKSGSPLAAPAVTLNPVPAPVLDIALYVESSNTPPDRNTSNCVGREGTCSNEIFDHTFNGDFAYSAETRWDADVVVLGGPAGGYLLAVDGQGIVRAVRNVQLVCDEVGPAGHPCTAVDKVYTPSIGASVDPDGNGSYTIADIKGGGYADVLFRATNGIRNEPCTATAEACKAAAETYNGLDVNGATQQKWPWFEWRDTLRSVEIVDHSGLEIRVRSIDVVADLNGTDVPVARFEPNSGRESGERTSASVQFNIRFGAAPSLVDIEKLGTVGDVVLTGNIVNPIGLTRVLNTVGAVRTEGSRTITTNVLDVLAGGSVGAITRAST